MNYSGNFISNSIDRFKKFFNVAEIKPKKSNVTDKDGHYDIDGVSIGESVIVAGEPLGQPGKAPAGSNSDVQYLPLSEKSLSEIQNQADATSFKMKNQKSPNDDGNPDKKDQFTSAKYSPGIEEYLDFEKAGD